MNMGYRKELDKVLDNTWKSTNKLRVEVGKIRKKTINYNLLQLSLMRMEIEGKVISFKHERLHLWKKPEKNIKKKDVMEKSINENEHKRVIFTNNKDKEIDAVEKLEKEFENIK